MGQSKQIDIRYLDRRVVERYVRKGVVSDKDYKDALKDLPDLEGEAVLMPIPEPGPAKEDTDDDSDEADA